MIKHISPKKILLVLAFMFSLQAFASFVDNGSVKKNSNDISLKNFSRNSYKTTAYPSFRLSKFQFKGSTSIYQISSNNFVEGQGLIRMENGNTAYVYPYKY